MLSDIYETLYQFLDVGGFIMPPLVLATLVLWYALGQRFVLLQRGNKRSVRRLIERHYNRVADLKIRGLIDEAVVAGLKIREQGLPNLRRRLDDRFNDFYERLHRHARLIRAIVIVSPLAGLLGTVAGMIETFDSLGEMTLYSQTGGIAGGISQALFTTQMGLAVAIPGLVLDRVLVKKQVRLERELAQIKDILCSKDFEELKSEQG